MIERNEVVRDIGKIAGIELELARYDVAARRTRNEGTGPVVRRASLAVVAAVTALIVLSLLMSSSLTSLFNGQTLLFLGLVGCIASFAAAFAFALAAAFCSCSFAFDFPSCLDFFFDLLAMGCS